MANSETVSLKSERGATRATLSEGLPQQLAYERRKPMRYLLCRPRGGLNDTLCRVQLCIETAARDNRHLIIDTSESGLMGQFSDFFTLEDRLLSEGHTPTMDSELLGRLEGLNTDPKYISEEIGLRAFLSLRWAERRLIAQAHGRRGVGADLTSDSPSELRYYEAPGGGPLAYRLLRAARVSEKVRQAVLIANRQLPARYIAAHIRATDYQAPVDDFLRRLRRQPLSLPLVVLSDNQAVVDHARKVFRKREFLAIARPEVPREGLPLHKRSQYKSSAAAAEATVASLVDLFILSRSDVLYLPFLDTRTTKGVLKLSGFSRLAAHLQTFPEVSRAFFGVDVQANPDPENQPEVHILSSPYRLWRAGEDRRLSPHVAWRSRWAE